MYSTLSHLSHITWISVLQFPQSLMFKEKVLLGPETTTTHIMSITKLETHSKRRTLIAPQLTTKTQTAQAIIISTSTLKEEIISERGRIREVKSENDTKQRLTTMQQREKITCGRIDLKEASDQDSALFRPSITLPSVTQRRAFSPITRDVAGIQRAATPHPMKATLARSGSLKITQQPIHSVSCYGDAGYVCANSCKWRYEEYKNQLHLDWLNRP